jgi:hypothetical protein
MAGAVVVVVGRCGALTDVVVLIAYCVLVADIAVVVG